MRNYLAALSLAIPLVIHAQTEIYKPYKNTDMWTADTLYMGASFIYTPSFKSVPVVVTLQGNEAGWLGDLYLVNPNSSKPPIYLFNNHDAPGTSVDVTSYLSKTLPTQLTFMYMVTKSYTAEWPLTPEDLLPKYTGPNRATDTYYSPASNDIMPNPNWRFGHRWAVVGKVPGSSGDLEFGFEDCTQKAKSDMDYDDVVFRVSGLQMGVFTRFVSNKDFVR